MVFDAFIGARSMSRYWPWYSLWGRKFLNSPISLAKLPSSHLGLLVYLFLRFSLEFWLLAFASPSSRVRLQLPAAAPMTQLSFLHLGKLQESAHRSVRVDLHPEKTAFLPRVFPLTSAGIRMTGGKSPWSGIRSCSGFLQTLWCGGW